MNIRSTIATKRNELFVTDSDLLDAQVVASAPEIRQRVDRARRLIREASEELRIALMIPVTAAPSAPVKAAAR